MIIRDDKIRCIDVEGEEVFVVLNDDGEIGYRYTENATSQVYQQTAEENPTLDDAERVVRFWFRTKTHRLTNSYAPIDNN